MGRERNGAKYNCARPRILRGPPPRTSRATGPRSIRDELKARSPSNVAQLLAARVGLACWRREKLSDVAVREGKQIKEFGYIDKAEPKPLIRLRVRRRRAARLDCDTALEWAIWKVSQTGKPDRRCDSWSAVCATDPRHITRGGELDWLLVSRKPPKETEGRRGNT